MKVKLTASGALRCLHLSLTQSDEIDLSVKKETLGMALKTFKTHEPCPLRLIFS